MAVLDLMPASLTAAPKGAQHGTDGPASVSLVTVVPKVLDDLIMNHVCFHFRSKQTLCRAVAGVSDSRSLQPQVPLACEGNLPGEHDFSLGGALAAWNVDSDGVTVILADSCILDIGTRLGGLYRAIGLGALRKVTVEDHDDLGA